MKTRLFKSRDKAQLFADKRDADTFCVVWREGADFKTEAFLIFYDASDEDLHAVPTLLHDALSTELMGNAPRKKKASI